MNKSAVPKSVLFVCLGNICRSPSAKSVFCNHAAQHNLNIQFDSAGTNNHTQGQAPDPRAQSVGKARGYDLSSLVARQITPADFAHYELILAMDAQNLADLTRVQQQAANLYPNQQLATLQPFDAQQDVADPYYGNIDDFAAMFDHLEHCATAYFTDWRSNGAAKK